MPRIAVSTCHSRGGRAGRERRGLGEAEAQRAVGGGSAAGGIFFVHAIAMHKGNIIDKLCPVLP